MRENTFGCCCFLSFLVVARLSQFLYSLYLVIPAGREFVSSDQNVMFWLVSEIATVVRRAEGTPSTLSAHGGSSCDIQLFCAVGGR